MGKKYILSEDEWNLVKDTITASREKETQAKEKAQDYIQQCYDAFVNAVYDYYDQFGTVPSVLSKH